jgi:hypothetical protein
MTTAITPIPPLDRLAPTFKADLEAMFATYFPNLTVELTAFLSALSTIASGGAMDIPFKFSTTTAAGDPGPGFLRLNSGAAGTVTTIYTDVLGSDTKDYTALLDTMSASSSAVLGQVRLVKLNDPTKFMNFNLTLLTAQTGYRQLTVIPTAYSDAMPFLDNDIVLFRFFRTGDRGSIGPAGTIVRRTTSVASNTAPAPDISTTDLYAITALAGAAVVGAPTNSGAAAADGQGLMFRIKDDGVAARALSWNAAYRAGSDVILPTTTVLGKVLYVGFIYNAAAAKWDLVSTLGNI